MKEVHSKELTILAGKKVYFYSFTFKALVSAGHDLHSTECIKGIFLEKKVKIWTKYSRTTSVEGVDNKCFFTD